MSRRPRWKFGTLKDGIQTITLSSWKYFSDFINQLLLDYWQYIYRGHTSADWKLESTLDRALKGIPKSVREASRRRHLNNFQYAVRGRRGLNPKELVSENDWWALGQHYGLSTPLLDWTESPFVALYFAFIEPGQKSTEYRSIWGLAQISATSKTTEITKTWRRNARKDRPPIVEIVRPLTDENARLVNQRGLFVRGPDGISIEQWIRENYKGHNKHWHLFKLQIPNKNRDQCLKFLNRMNINHLSLFPDLSGAAKYCNMDLQIDNY